MAQVSYGTITINDITDISDVYLEYGLAISGANVTNEYPFNSLGEVSWNTIYPTWQSGYQIWIREVQEKEGVQQKEYKTPYLDTAVNQINNNYINLQSKIKKIWSNNTGSYMASGIGNNDVNEDNVSTYGYNSKSTTTGISFNYNNIPLIEMGILNSGDFSGIKLYSPVLTNSIISSSRLDATLTSWGLKLLKGGIEAGSVNAGDDGYIYFSTEDYPKDPGLSINGHLPGNDDPAWRAIIGEKFGVDAEGNLYASNASIEGAITATSLTISSNGDFYNAWEAINVTGYAIEIEETDIDGSIETKKLTPHLYHNGVNADTEVTDWTSFIWYQDEDTIGITGDSIDGSIIGYYGSTYRVTYRFEDGSVGAGTEITTITVQPTDYITDINNTGIKIHPKNHDSGNYIQLDGTGMEIFKIGETDVSIAVFGANGARIGALTNGHTIIQASGMKVYANDGTIELANIGYGSGNAENGTAVAPYYTFGRRLANSEVGNFSVAEGENTTASGAYSHAEGWQTIASGRYSHVEGGTIITYPGGSHYVTASGGFSHAEGGGSVASGGFSHAEGKLTAASGDGSHAEGESVTASGDSSHAEGVGTEASGTGSHAEGNSTVASGAASHASGQGTIAEGASQTVVGKYNESDTTSLFIVGYGYNRYDRLNAFTVDTEGNVCVGLFTTTISGTDHDLYQAITALGWQNDVIV